MSKKWQRIKQLLINSYYFGICFTLIFLSSCAKKKNIREDSDKESSPFFGALSVDDIRTMPTASCVQDVQACSDVQDITSVPVDEQVAKSIDIPIAFDCMPVLDVSFSHASFITFSYQCYQDCQVIGTFYEHEMECCGWSMLSQFVAHERVMVFTKPQRTCVVVIRSDLLFKRKKKRDQRCVVTIFVER